MKTPHERHDESAALTPAEERRLDALLGPAPLAEASDPGLAADRLFVADLRRSRARSSDWSGVREGALVGRVLARTTREDLSWRGDLRLLGGFLRERWGTTPSIRWVAAAALLHVLALPVVGWVLVREKQERVFHVTLEQRSAPDLEAPEELLESHVPLSVPGFDGPPVDRVSNARQRARYRLTTCERSFPAADPESPAAIRLLALRGELWKTRAVPDLPETPASFEAAALFEGILWTELLLDRLLLEDRAPPLLAFAVGALERGARREGAVPTALAELRSMTLARAHAYGQGESPAGFDPQGIPDLLAPEWCALLGRAAAELGLAEEPLVLAWSTPLLR